MNISTTIKREYFELIAAKKKRMEFRAATEYWNKRLRHTIVNRITLICGRDVLTAPVNGVTRMTTPFDLLKNGVIKTRYCYGISMYLDAMVVTRR